MKKGLTIVYGVICYVIFLVTFLYAVGFIGNLLVPKSIDSPDNGTGGDSIITNILLLSVFALQHSIMARPEFKKWWTRIVPTEIERSTYVLLSSLALVLIFWKWDPNGQVVWEVVNPVGKSLLTATYFLGWLIVLLSTFMINHFDLFGLKQVFYYFKNKPLEELNFNTNWFYRIVRHPIMLGFLIAFWSAPVMTMGHLLFSITTSMYILVAVKFLEERDLVKALGADYKKYQKTVPMLIPFTKKRQNK